MTVNYSNQGGTTQASFVVGGPVNGITLKLTSGALEVMNASASSDTSVTASLIDLSASTNQIVLGSANTHPLTLSSGTPTATWTLTLPVSSGTSGYVLSTDGTGITSWVAAASTAPALKNFITTVPYNGSSPIAIDTLPGGCVIDHVVVINDTAWTDPTATLSVGITGNVSKYVGTSDNYLSFTDRFNVDSSNPADASPETINVYFNAGTSSAGSTRVEVWYFTPTP